MGEDTCRGTISFDFDPDASPPVVGTSSCTFEGALALAGEIPASLDADFTGDGDEIVGDAAVSIPFIGEYVLPWGGTASSAGVSSHVSDSVEVEGFLIDYQLDFDAVP